MGVPGRMKRAALIGAAVVATLTGCSPAPGWESDTYVYTAPATAVDGLDLTQTVLVRDGVVTDVWINEDLLSAPDIVGYGYTPRTPAEREHDEGVSRVDTDSGEILLCSDVGTEIEYCPAYRNVHALTDHQAEELSAWDPPRDGTLTVRTFSVTWGLGQAWAVVLRDGELASATWLGGDGDSAPPASAEEIFAPGSTPEHRVTYWVVGADAPFAACVDAPNSYDEEYCWEWGD